MALSEITSVVTTVAVAVVTKANTKAKRIKSWRMSSPTSVGAFVVSSAASPFGHQSFDLET